MTVTLVAHTYCIDRHVNDDDEKIPCPRCNGTGERIIRMESSRVFCRVGDEHFKGYILDCALCGGYGGEDKPEFGLMLSEEFGSDVQDVTLSIDNCYYITLYANPERPQPLEPAMIEHLWHYYDDKDSE